MSAPIGDVSPDTSSRKSRSSAERMRRHRRRRSRGFRIVRIQIGLAEIEGLIERAYLPKGDKENVKAIEFAANAFISDALLGL